MKRALVLSGGGSKGAYQAGVVYHLLAEKGIVYDAYCGVSVGALNGSYLATFSKGEEKDAAVALMKVWKEITTSAVRKRWFPFGKVHALWKPSLYDSSPLMKLVNSMLDVEKLLASDKELAVGTASLTTGKYRVFDKSHPEIVKAVLASSSFPAMLCPVDIDGELWTDGGVRDVTPIKAAIDLGAEQIDVVMTSPVEKTVNFDKNPNTIDVAMQSIDTLADEVMENDIVIANLISELAYVGRRKDKRRVFINVLRPSKKLPGQSLDFERKDLDEMIELGLSDAAKAGWKKQPFNSELHT